MGWKFDLLYINVDGLLQLNLVFMSVELWSIY